MLLADSGNAASSADPLRVIYQAMVHMGCDAAGVGIMETALGAAVMDVAKEAGLPLVGEVGPEPGESKPGRTQVRVGEVTVGVVSIGWAPDPETTEFRDAVHAELQAAREEADFVILLSQLGREDDVDLLKQDRFRDLADVVVGGPMSWPASEPDFVGRTLLLPGGHKGRELGVLEVYLTDQRIHYHHDLITMAPDLPEDEKILKLVDEYYETHKEQPRELPVAGGANQPPLPDAFSDEEAARIRSRGYLVAPECAKCHTEQYEQWETTHHAHALDTLIDAKRTVRECLTCHSESYRRGLPYDPEGDAKHGVDCAACHGAGLFHASTEGAQDTIVRKPGEMVCRRCHTAARDVGFEMDARLQKVTH